MFRVNWSFFLKDNNTFFAVQLPLWLGWKICVFDFYCLKFVSLWFYFLEEKDSTGAVKKKRVLCEMCIQKQTHAMRIFAISLILREIREDSKF